MAKKSFEAPVEFESIAITSNFSGCFYSSFVTRVLAGAAASLLLFNSSGNWVICDVSLWKRGLPSSKLVCPGPNFAFYGAFSQQLSCVPSNKEEERLIWFLSDADFFLHFSALFCFPVDFFRRKYSAILHASPDLKKNRQMQSSSPSLLSSPDSNSIFSPISPFVKFLENGFSRAWKNAAAPWTKSRF